MRNIKFTRTKAAVVGWLFAALLTACSPQQTATKPTSPPGTVTQIDEVGLRKLMVPDGKPLLINFWATWCGPCREEFPDLVKLDQEFKGKIEFLTVSLDDPAEITTSVPQFLASMKAEMPAYLLKTADENSVITSVSKEWHGALPFTILYDANGTARYEREGKVHLDVVRSEIEKIFRSYTLRRKCAGARGALKARVSAVFSTTCSNYKASSAPMARFCLRRHLNSGPCR